MFSSGSFMGSDLTFKSLIHLELFFVTNVRQVSSLICSHVNKHFLSTIYERTVFSPLNIQGSLVKYYLSGYAWVCFCQVPSSKCLHWAEPHDRLWLVVGKFPLMIGP